MKNKLLTCMEIIKENESYKVHIFNAWVWFIILLQGYVLENMVFVNNVLKTLEQTLLDTHIEKWIVSMDAWKSMVDILGP